MEGFLSEAVKRRQNGFACPSTACLGLRMFHIFNAALIHIFTHACMAGKSGGQSPHTTNRSLYPKEETCFPLNRMLVAPHAQSPVADRLLCTP
jgi:hypothetical protein